MPTYLDITHQLEVNYPFKLMLYLLSSRRARPSPEIVINVVQAFLVPVENRDDKPDPNVNCISHDGEFPASVRPLITATIGKQQEDG